MRRRTAFLLLATATATITSAADPAQSIVQEAKLVAPNAAVADYFGRSLAIRGDTALCAAFDADGGRGAVFVFDREDGVWTQSAKLVAADAATTNDWVGSSVAFDGDTAVAGATGRDARGAAFVFVRDGAAWTQQAEITSRDLVTDDDFGSAVALAGDTLVVAATKQNMYRGAVYVFTRTGTEWTPTAKLVAPDAMDYDFFGWSLATDGDTILVGTGRHDENRGAVYVFARSGAKWQQQAELVAPDAATGDSFGVSVALEGATAAIGAYGRNANRGAVFTFVREGATWTQQAEIAASDLAEMDLFGASVGLSGGTLVAGEIDMLASRGAAYAFTRDGATWTQVAKFLPADVVGHDFFGSTVALDGGTALLCAFAQDDGRGAVYVESGLPYTPPPPPVPFGIASATPGELANGTTMSVAGRGFGARARAWLDLDGRRVRLRVGRDATDTRLDALLAASPRKAHGVCTLNVLPRGAAAPYTLPGVSIEAPRIDAVDPPSAAPGTRVTISGAWFGSKRGRVRIGGAPCAVAAWTDGAITAVVPRGVAPGAASVEVKNRTGSAGVSGFSAVK